ncbi:MAG: hypothetical protein F6K31_22685 [Symploca sp. SIO2G7]|nr:hypothetical protein [Symploca sp. SIO2G7]
MSKFIPSSKSLPCPICGDSKGKCRTKEDNGKSFVLCMAVNNATKGEIINGYKCLNPNGRNAWASTWVQTSDDDDYDPELAQKRRQQAQKEERRYQQFLKSGLPVRERDKNIRLLSRYLGLSKLHRENLLQRGLSAQVIAEGGFFSVEPNQHVPRGISPKTPGIRFGKISVGQPGLACPAFDSQGQVTGYQIRLDEATQNKYRWAKGERSSHLLNGELPITVTRPVEGEPHNDAIWMAEGILKPFVAAQKHQRVVMGASGANFASSPEQLQRYLGQASDELGTKLIGLCPDAGAVANGHVIRSYRKTFDLLEGWGYEVKIVWWGQFKKTLDKDVDEISVDQLIQYISLEEFETICIEHGGYIPPNQSASIKKSNSQHKDDSWLKYLKPIPELPNTGFHVVRRDKDELVENFPALETEIGKEWLQLRKFTPDHTINQQYFDFNPPKTGEGLAVKSGLGTGKSWWANQKYLANPDDGAVIGGYRNVLLEQFCSNGHLLNGRHWYQIQGDLKANGELVLLADPHSRIAGAVDSWGYFSPHHFENKKILFDEVESVARHLHHSNTAVSMYRETIKQRVVDALTNGDSFFLSDANLTDFTVEYFSKLSGRKITKVENTYTGNRGKIYLYDGSSRHRQATQKDVDDGLASQVGEWMEFDVKTDDCSKLHKIMTELPPDIPIIISADSQTKCETWDSMLSKKGRKVFRLDSTTSNTSEGKEFLRDPKAFILKYGINTVILSPSAESGVSIDMRKASLIIDFLESSMPSFFKYEFAFFFGVAATDTQVQFLGRNRDPETLKFVFCQQHSSLHSKLGFSNQTSNGLHQAYIDYTLDCAKISLSGLSEEEKKNELLNLAAKLVEKSIDPHYEYECRVIAKDNFERKHPRLCLEYALRDSGWDVTVVRGREDDILDLREQQEKIQLAEAGRLYKSETLTQGETDKLARKLNKTPDERRQVSKSRLLLRLPGFENKTIQAEKKLSPTKVIETATSHLILEIDGVKANEDGFAEKLKEVQQLAVQEQVETQGNNTQQTTDNDTEQMACDNHLENPGVTQAETQEAQGLEPVTQQADNSLKTRGDVLHPFNVVFEKPAFDPEFIHTVQNKDRSLISRIEAQFLLLNPEAAKLLQQQRWYKKLSIFTDPSEPDCKKKIHLATYRSKWLQIHTLLEMGIGWFLNPENSWHSKTPELLEFWEKGKDPKRQRNIGVSAQNTSPCQYLGKVLKKFELKTKGKQKRTSDGVVRLYCIDKSPPLHQAILESVTERINSKISEFVFDWKKVVENGGVTQAEIHYTQGLEPVTQQADNSLKTRGDVLHLTGETGLPDDEGQCTDKTEEISPTEFELLRRISEESSEKGQIFRSMLMGVKKITRLLYDQIMTEFAFASF